MRSSRNRWGGNCSSRLILSHHIQPVITRGDSVAEQRVWPVATDRGSIAGQAPRRDDQQNRLVVVGSQCDRRGLTGKCVVIPRRVAPVRVVSVIVRESAIGERNYAVAQRSLACQFEFDTSAAVSRQLSVDGDFCTQRLSATPYRDGLSRLSSHVRSLFIPILVQSRQSRF